MKNLSFYRTIVTAIAGGTILFTGSVTQAQALSRARGGIPLQSRLVRQRQSPASSIPAAPGYPTYRLIELPTLGGPNSGQVAPAVTLNNRGDAIAVASTDMLDPNPFTLQDEFIWHGILSDAKGLVSDLGALPGTNQSLPVWISGNGLIVGASENGLTDETVDFPQLRPVWWDSARNIHDLGTFGGNTGWATTVNNRGQVAGYTTNMIPEDPDAASFMNGFLPAGQQVRAFLWEGGALSDLGTLGGNDAAAQAINENGEIAGLSYTNTIINETTGLPTVHPFLWKNGTMQDLGSLGGSLATPASFANGPFGKFLNARGEVAGTSLLPGDEDWHAFLWSNGRMIDLGTLGGNVSDAYAINDGGQVVGRARTTNVVGSHHPFLWEKGGMADLGVVAPCTRGTAKAINSRGDVAGGFGGCGPDPDDRTYFRGFYWQKGKPIVDVNTLITPASDVWVDEISFINDTGTMIGAGILPDGSTRAVLLIPIPPGH